jgi:hypothetical protein
MADIILIPEAVPEGGVQPADINKALINVQKQLDELIARNTATVTVDGVVKKLLWKVLTGASTGGTGTLTVPHGLDATKILTVTGQINSSGNYIYMQEASGTALQMYTYNDATNAVIGGINASYYNMPYKITIAYTD